MPGNEKKALLIVVVDNQEGRDRNSATALHCVDPVEIIHRPLDAVNRE